jgi:hypothetical protein
MRVLHLMTQDDQPYGSERRCCERCGVQILYRRDPPTWTDNREAYGSPPDGYVACASSTSALSR